ncbi:hypothetical protein CHLRE_17g732050v5 [Chlamydomonas reinhardtii]|uniref:HhH-GPD domain-containing protein n=1 Tax=Chlamydomonas reinhardtii TaxID=3055 RepID=A0A2K3CR18_CHLRE|nr:uncharacterized protein CHLRE_17g732050v5 [Chlamydomonas reinhardtii]PNW70727.1 hypothetical protein CHLRE_17g732050v5 [Chlamydomonas reinhardtii]
MAPRGTKRPLSDTEERPSPSVAGVESGPGLPSPPPPGAAGSSGPTPSLAPTPTPSKKKLKPLPATPSFQAASLTALRAKAARIQAQLAQLYPNPPIPLTHASSFQLLVAVMLSAQSTDVKVNTVTPELFRRGPDAEAMAKLEASEIEGIIRVLGLAPTKAKNVRAMSQILVEQYDGQVPGSWEGLEALPGVGHKTASVVMSQAFGHAAFPVDTHIHRLAQRWGLSNGKSVEQTEQDLKTLLPECTWRDAHLQIIYFGREHCPAQRHDATACPICSWAAPAAARAGGGAGTSGPADIDGSTANGSGAATPSSRKGAAATATAAATKRRKLKAVSEEEASEDDGERQGAGGDAGEVAEATAGPGGRGNGAAKGRARGGGPRTARTKSAVAVALATSAVVVVEAADDRNGSTYPATAVAAPTAGGAAAGTAAADAAVAGVAVAGAFDAFRAGGPMTRGTASNGRRSAAAGGSAAGAMAAAQGVAPEAQAGSGAALEQGGDQGCQDGDEHPAAMGAAGGVRRSGRQGARRGGQVK